MWNNVTIQKRITAGFACILVLFAVVAFMTHYGFTSLAGAAQDVIVKNELIANLLQREVDHLKWAAAVSDVLTTGMELKLNVQTDPTLCAFGKWYYSPERKAAERVCPELAGILKDIEPAHTQLHHSAVEIGRCLDQADTSTDAAEKMSKAQTIFGTDTKQSLGKVQEYLTNARGIVKTDVEATNVRMLQSAAITKHSVSFIFVAAIIAGIVLVILICRGIGKKLKHIIDALALSSQQVASASGQVSTASQSLAEGATQQAAGLQETSSSLEEMSSMTKQNADNAGQANRLAEEAGNRLRTGPN